MSVIPLPFGIVDALDRPDLAADERFGTDGDRVEHPLDYDGADAGFEDGPPLLGEHTEEILRELGYDDERIARLREAGTISDGET